MMSRECSRVKRPNRFNSLHLFPLILLILLPPAWAAVEPADQTAPVISPSSLNVHQWGALTLFHGLPSDLVWSIAQDGEGTLWFGTSNGLARYDGRRVQKIVADGLPAGRVRALKIDTTGALWVGTDNGACRSTEGRFETLAETSGHAVTAFAAQGDAVFLTSEDGFIFACSNERGGVKTSVVGPRDSYLLSDSTGTPVRLTSLGVLGDKIYVGTQGRGLLSVKGKEVTEIKSKPRQYFVTAIAIGVDGKPWFGTDRIRQDFGLYDGSDPLKPRRVVESGRSVTSISFDQQGQVWSGTDGEGAFLVGSNGETDHITFEASAGGLRSNHIYSVFVDREGVVWFGTDRGACRYDPHSPHAERISENPQTNFVRAFYESRDGRQWAGTNRGLFVRQAGRDWKQVPELEDRTIYAVTTDPAGRILVGSASGLFALAGGADTFIPVERAGEALPSADNIRAIEIFQGSVYVARYGAGIDRIDGDSRTPAAEPKDSRDREIVSLHSDGDRLWMGTSAAGLMWFDGKHIGSEQGLEQLRSTGVLGIDSSRSGLWLATGQGLDLYTDGKLDRILEGDEVRCVSASDRDNSAWFGTARGLYRTLQSQSDTPGMVRLTAEHGLPSDNVFSIFARDDGPTGDIIWAGTNRGIVSYQPGHIAPLLKATRVLGQRVFQGDELVAWLRLDYPQNSMLVEVAATSSRTFPEQFQYSFLVEDFAGHKIRQAISSDPQLLVEDLRPGRYRATARAFTIDLVPSEPLTLNFEVASPPFPWSTAALSTLLGLALVALWWGYHQNRRLAHTNLALEGANRKLAAARLQLATETENERRRIARDLHDQTLADLRGLLLTVDQSSADRNAARPLEPAVLRQEIESISTEIRRICEDLSPSVLANVGLAAALEWALSDAVAHMPADRKFEYSFHCGADLEDRLRLDASVEIQVYRIIQEAISNVCRHAGANRVDLTAEIDETGDFVVTLEDNGKGFDPNARAARTGRGLTNMRARASLIDAKIGWSSKPGRGAVFTLRKNGVARHTDSVEGESKIERG